MRIIDSAKLNESFFEYKELADAAAVRTIVSSVIKNRDEAVRYYTTMFDGCTIKEPRISEDEIDAAYARVDKDVAAALRSAADNIKRFSKKQLEQFRDFEFEIVPGVFVGQKVTAIDRVGIYVPGGRFPLVSTLLMCAIPAQVAGVADIVLCSPPRFKESIHPMILAACGMCGIKEAYKIGGVQAIAAMAYGTQTIRKVDKIVGPGNKFVTQAKKEVFGVSGIDFVAGPTEILIIADETAHPDIVAADLLAQAEHDVEAVPVLVTVSRMIAEEVNKEIDLQLSELTTRDTAKESIENNGIIILARNIDEAIDIANKKSPEHLQLHIKNPAQYIDKLVSFGSLFIGEYAAEAFGDYSAGVNHTLPTNTCARYTAGLGVKDFVKLQTTLRVEERGLDKIGPVAKVLASIEGLDGHARSITKRLKRS